MKILIVEPGKHPYEAEIDSRLESLQKTVGGYIEAIYPFEDMVALISDEEAKLKSDTQWNRILGRDVIKGTFFLCGIEGENFCAPELFIPTPNGLLPIILRDAP